MFQWRLYLSFCTLYCCCLELRKSRGTKLCLHHGGKGWDEATNSSTTNSWSEKCKKYIRLFEGKKIHLLDCMGVARVAVNGITLEINLHTIRLFRPSLWGPWLLPGTPVKTMIKMTLWYHYTIMNTYWWALSRINTKAFLWTIVSRGNEKPLLRLFATAIEITDCHWFGDQIYTIFSFNFIEKIPNQQLHDFSLDIKEC